MGTPAAHVCAHDSGISFQANTDRWVRPGHGSTLTQSAVSRQGESVWQTGAVWSGLWASVITNTRDLAATISSQLSATGAGPSPGNQSITVPAGTTGTFQDAVNTDAVSAGNEVYILVRSNHSVGTTQGFVIPSIASLFTSTADERCYRLFSNGGRMNENPVTGPALPNFFPCYGFGGSFSTLTESTVQGYFPAGTLRRPSVLVFSHLSGSNPVDYRLRVNEGDTSILISVPAGMTGTFSDLSNSVAINDFDRPCWQISNADDHLGFSEYIVIDLVTDVFFGGFTRGGANSTAPMVMDGDAPVSDPTREGVSLTSGFPNTGNVVPANENQTQVAALVTDTWGGLMIFAKTNGQLVSVFMYGRLNGVDTNFVITIPATMTGLFIAVGTTEAITPTDLLSVRRSIPDNGGGPNELEFHQQYFWIIPDDEGDKGPPRNAEVPWDPPDFPPCPGDGETGSARNAEAPYTPTSPTPCGA